jgi:hypothetical protein
MSWGLPFIQPQFTSLHFTSLHFTSLPFRWSPLHFALFITFLTLQFHGPPTVKEPRPCPLRPLNKAALNYAAHRKFAQVVGPSLQASLTCRECSLCRLLRVLQEVTAPSPWKCQFHVWTNRSRTHCDSSIGSFQKWLRKHGYLQRWQQWVYLSTYWLDVTVGSCRWRKHDGVE